MFSGLKKYPSLWITAIVSLLAHGVIMAWVSDWYEAPSLRSASEPATAIEIKLMPRVVSLPEKAAVPIQTDSEVLQTPAETQPLPKIISRKKPVVTAAKQHKAILKPIELPQKNIRPRPEQTIVVQPVVAVAVSEISNEQLRDEARQRYIQKLLARINQNKVYPRRARIKNQQGLVMIGFDVGRGGVIKNIRLVKSSGVGRLDKSALKVINELGVLDPLPSVLGIASLDLAVPMEYRLQ